MVRIGVCFSAVQVRPGRWPKISGFRDVLPRCYTATCGEIAQLPTARFRSHNTLTLRGRCRATSFFNGQPPLSEGAGYAVVVGFGAFFSIFTTILVFLDYRFGGTKQTSEQVCLFRNSPCHWHRSSHCAA